MRSQTDQQAHIYTLAHYSRVEVEVGQVFDPYSHNQEPSSCVIESGTIALFAQVGQNERFFLTIVGKGFIFSVDADPSAASSSLNISAEAITPTFIRYVRSARWKGVCASHPQLREKSLCDLAALSHAIQGHLSWVRDRSNSDRALFAIQRFAYSQGEAVDNGYLSVLLRRTELARWLGLSYDRVGRIIRDLHNKGDVRISGHKLLVRASALPQRSHRMLSAMVYEPGTAAPQAI